VQSIDETVNSAKYLNRRKTKRMITAKTMIVLKGREYLHGDLVRGHLGLTQSQMWRASRNGRLPPPIKLGKASYYNWDDVERYLTKVKTA
jgi:predicted DNA-binding transcriptional regulator AlpA